ncbi:MAG: HYR domain-containing protein [Syntrophothermus sp.]
MKQKFSTALSLAVILAMLLTSLVLADNLVDNATSAGLDTITAGGSTTITYQLVANGTPGTDPAGCDATSSKPVTVTINKPGAVSGPTSFSFTGCGQPNKVSVTFTSNTPGSYSITHTISGGVSGSQFNNNADFTLTVNAVTPTNTAPTLSLSSDLTVEATGAAGAAVSYTVTASDTEDGPLTPSCAPASGSTFPLGTTQVNCSVSDSGGLTTSGMFNVTVRDTTAPTLNLSNVTAEATGPSGAAVSYTASATDAVDGAVTPTCSPTSGSTFALGTTTVNCSASDSSGNVVSNSFTVTVQDTTAPAVSVPSNVSSEATGPAGAAVTFSVSASDLVDGAVATICTPASGSTFALGATAVNCSAVDAAGNIGSASFTVTVVDTTAPSLSLPANITAEATGASGAAVSYTASASDLVDGAVVVNCSPASGSTFALGTASVNCSATDAHNNTATGSFTVTVRDTTPPALSLPSDINVYATGNSSAVVTYSASASDIVDGPVSITCTPASGSSFAAGSTTVSCSATDSHGNTATGSFKVNVNYNWSGFFQPIDNNGVYNVAKSGSTIPVKFSLGGDQGLGILFAGSPSSAQVSCPLSAATDSLEEVTTATSGLKYDALANQYIYNWKTSSGYAGTCRQLTVKLVDGSTHTALFKFTK